MFLFALYLRSIALYLRSADKKALFRSRVSRSENTRITAYARRLRILASSLGGAFSEGIDLVSDRLIGVSIVGIGLPMVSPSVDLIREYYDKKEQKGFEYAYMDPGMNKVMQAVGRLIRSEEDRGAALLIDDRYLREEYRSLFQRRWSTYEVVVSPEDLKEELKEFYRKK